MPSSVFLILHHSCLQLCFSESGIVSWPISQLFPSLLSLLPYRAVVVHTYPSSITTFWTDSQAMTIATIRNSQSEGFLVQEISVS